MTIKANKQVDPIGMVMECDASGCTEYIRGTGDNGEWVRIHMSAYINGWRHVEERDYCNHHAGTVQVCEAD